MRSLRYSFSDFSPLLVHNGAVGTALGAGRCARGIFEAKLAFLHYALVVTAYRTVGAHKYSGKAGDASVMIDSYRSVLYFQCA